MSNYPIDWQRRKTGIRNKLENVCQRCGIVLDDTHYHYWKGKLRKDSMFLHTHHMTPLSSGGKNSYDNLTLLCAGCHSYQAGHEHLREKQEVEEYYQIFRPFYFNKKRNSLYGQMKGTTNRKKAKSILANIGPHKATIEALELEFEKLVTICRKQLRRTGKKFRDFTSVEQALIMIYFYNGWNTFGVLPTGSGKSLCFTSVAEALEDEGLTVVISPLISLMKDMKAKFNRCECFNSTLSQEERRKVKAKISRNEISLLLISPERLKEDNFKTFLESTRISRIVIDEAHCITEWGYRFRIKYLRIIDFIKDYNAKHQKQIPILLLTATATAKTAKKILASLELDQKKCAIVLPATLKRDNLHYQIEKCTDDGNKLQLIKKKLKQMRKSKGIIFSLFANQGENAKGAYDAESICESLSKLKGCQVRYYHGKLSTYERNAVQDWFCEKNPRKNKVLVATSAFGMGVDIPDIRFIYHFYPPLSMESYWQETGRAGRDDKDSDCILFYANGDLDRMAMFGLLPRFEKIAMIYEALVNGNIIIPFNASKNRKFSRFIDELKRLRVVKKQKPKRQIANRQFVVYEIRRDINMKSMEAMWAVAKVYPKKFSGFPYKRICSLIEIYSNHIKKGDKYYRVPAGQGGGAKNLALRAVNPDLNVFLELGAFEMHNMKDSLDRYSLLDAYYSPRDFERMEEWLGARRDDVNEAKSRVSKMVRTKNLQRYVDKFWGNELKNLNSSW